MIPTARSASTSTGSCPSRTTKTSRTGFRGCGYRRILPTHRRVYISASRVIASKGILNVRNQMPLGRVRLRQRIVDRLAKSNPLFATEAGIPGYERLLPDYSAAKQRRDQEETYETCKPSNSSTASGRRSHRQGGACVSVSRSDSRSRGRRVTSDVLRPSLARVGDPTGLRTDAAPPQITRRRRPASSRPGSLESGAAR